MRIAIGIISYFPDNQCIRKERVKMLQALINQCDKLFDLPVLIVAQNWQNDTVSGKDLTIKHYPKLGITGARKELRRLFLDAGYDHLIMLDDDCIIAGSHLDGMKYIREIELHPNGYAIRRGTLLKMATFSREIMQKVDFPCVSPEKNEGYEDYIFVKTVENLFSERRFKFKDNLLDLSNSKNDPLSVWRNEYKDTIDRDLCIENTEKIIKQIKEKT